MTLLDQMAIIGELLPLPASNDHQEWLLATLLLMSLAKELR